MSTKRISDADYMHKIYGNQVDAIEFVIDMFADALADKVLNIIKERDGYVASLEALHATLNDAKHDQADLSVEKALLDEIAQLKQESFDWRSWATSILTQPGSPPVDIPPDIMRSFILEKLKATGNQ